MENLIEKFIKHPCYLSNGANKLAKDWKVSAEEVKTAKQKAREILKEENKDNKNVAFEERLEDLGLKIEDVKTVKFWQNMNGENRFSINTKDQWYKQAENFKKEFIEDIKKYSPVKPKIEYKFHKDNPVAYEISLPDFHLSKITGESIDEQVQIFLRKVAELHEKGLSLNIERFILPCGNDIFNSEGLRQSTTKGTPQQDNSDWQTSFRTGWKMIVEAVDYLLMYAPVDIIFISGNHAYETEFHLGEVISAWYHNNPNVFVDNSFDSRKYYTYGVNLLGFSHGDNEKPHDLPLIMATEKPNEFAKATYRSWHLGHFHKEMSNEYRGVEVKFLPSLCGNDFWHKKMGYNSQRRAQAFIWSKERGCEGFMQVNI